MAFEQHVRPLLGATGNTEERTTKQMWLRLRDAVKIVPGEATPEMSIPSQEPRGSQMGGTPQPASPSA